MRGTGKFTTRARVLRKESTDAERLLWRHLRGRCLDGYKFRRQVPIEPYIADFVCLDARLIVELDGGQHAGQGGYDARRTAALEARGYRVVRFWNHEVLGETEHVLERIRAALIEAPSPRPSPAGRGGQVFGARAGAAAAASVESKGSRSPRERAGERGSRAVQAPDPEEGSSR